MGCKNSKDSISGNTSPCNNRLGTPSLDKDQEPGTSSNELGERTDRGTEMGDPEELINSDTAVGSSGFKDSSGTSGLNLSGTSGLGVTQCFDGPV